MSGSHARPARRGRVVPIVVAAVLLGAVVLGILPRFRQARTRNADVQANTGVNTVFTEMVQRDSAGSTLELPGSVAGLHEIAIYARTNGFVKALRVDIGSTVRAGDTLALLDMPDVSEQLRQARASMEQVEATAALARSTLVRWRALREQEVVTPQEFDERQAAANVADANVRVARANVANLSELVRFGALTAPFSGVVTARTIDVGSLVSAGAAAANRALFTLVQVDTLRVLFSVPQSAATLISVGQRAEVAVRELGDSTFSGHVALTSRAIDAASRTMLTEVHVENAGRRLMPGMFATVTLALPAAGSGLRIPAIALIIRADGTQVARVTDGTVHLVPVSIGRDFGTTLEVLDGVQEGDALIVNPSELLNDGMVVKSVAREKKAAKP